MWMTVAWGLLKAYWKPLVATILLAVVYGYIHHQGYTSGEHSADEALAAAQARADASDNRAAEYAQAALDWKVIAAQRKAAEEAQAAASKVAIAQAEHSRAEAQRSLGQWKRNYQVLLNNPRTAAQMAGPDCSLPPGDY